MFGDVRASLTAAGLEAVVFSDFQGNPVLSDVVGGVEMYKAGQHDGVVAFGGGSSIDVGKAIGFGAVQCGPVKEYLIGSLADAPAIVAKSAGGLPPIVSVPTTSGTGSEIGRSSAIVDEEAKEKKGLFHPNMLPRVCLADPELTIGLGPDATAAFGMDALAHSLEAYCSKGFHPFSDGCGLQGTKLVAEWLPRATADGSDLLARSYLMAASLAGGVAFQKGVGAAHALAHPLSARHGIHHGLAVGVLLPYVVAFNLPYVRSDLAGIARYLDLSDCSAGGVVDWLISLRAEIGIPHTIRDLGVGEGDVGELAVSAARDLTAGENPVPVGEEDARQLYRLALAGVVK